MHKESVYRPVQNRNKAHGSLSIPTAEDEGLPSQTEGGSEACGKGQGNILFLGGTVRKHFHQNMLMRRGTLAAAGFMRGCLNK